MSAEMFNISNLKSEIKIFISGGNPELTIVIAGFFRRENGSLHVETAASCRIHGYHAHSEGAGHLLQAHNDS